MDKSRKCKLSRPHTSTWNLGSFKHSNRSPRLGQPDRGCQPIRPRTNHNRIRARNIHYYCRSRTFSRIPFSAGARSRSFCPR